MNTERILKYSLSLHHGKDVLFPDGLCTSLTATDYKHPKMIFVEDNAIDDDNGVVQTFLLRDGKEEYFESVIANETDFTQ